MLTLSFRSRFPSRRGPALSFNGSLPCSRLLFLFFSPPFLFPSLPFFPFLPLSLSPCRPLSPLSRALSQAPFLPFHFLFRSLLFALLSPPVFVSQRQAATVTFLLLFPSPSPAPVCSAPPSAFCLLASLSLSLSLLAVSLSFLVCLSPSPLSSLSLASPHSQTQPRTQLHK